MIDAFIEVSGGRAVDHALGQCAFVSIMQGGRPIYAEIVMTKQGKVWRTFGGADHQTVFRVWPVERPAT